jgi:hypothetical protein
MYYVWRPNCIKLVHTIDTPQNETYQDIKIPAVHGLGQIARTRPFLFFNFLRNAEVCFICVQCCFKSGFYMSTISVKTVTSRDSELTELPIIYSIICLFCNAKAQRQCHSRMHRKSSLLFFWWALLLMRLMWACSGPWLNVSSKHLRPSPHNNCLHCIPKAMDHLEVPSWKTETMYE